MTYISELQSVFFHSKIISMVFFTKGDVIFRFWPCHPGFAVLIIRLHPGFLARNET
jgi:hypothetical protein